MIVRRPKRNVCIYILTLYHQTSFLSSPAPADEAMRASRQIILSDIEEEREDDN